MFALLQLLLPEVAAHQSVAVLVDPVGEVLASHADAGSLPALELPLVNETPLLHHSCRLSTHVLAGIGWSGQDCSDTL